LKVFIELQYDILSYLDFLPIVEKDMIHFELTELYWKNLYAYIYGQKMQLNV